MTLITCSARLSAFGIIRQSSPATTRTHKPICGLSSIIPSAGSERLKLKPKMVALCSWRHLTSKPISVCSRTIIVSVQAALAVEDHRGESPYQDIGSYQIIQAPQPTEAELTRGRGRGKKPQVYTKPDGDGFDELAWELDQYTAHTDLNDLEKIASIFMRANARSPDHKIAELLGVSQGYYSKLQVKIAEKMRAGRKKWRAANGLPEFDEPFLEYAPSYPAHRHLYGD